MYVEDMDLDEARAWEDELSGKLYHKGARMTGPEYLQASQDLEDVRERIAELTPSTTGLVLPDGVSFHTCAPRPVTPPTSRHERLL